MKSVILIRHAKSSWDNISLKDFDRPLNERGEKDAAKMAKRLLKKDVKIDAFLTSPAKRAYTTCKYFADEYDVKEKKIIQIQNLYEPSVEAFYEAIQNADDDFKTIAIFSHNPGITAFVNQLSRVRIDDMPTCAAFALHADIKQWKDFQEGEKIFWFFDYPKMKE